MDPNLNTHKQRPRRVRHRQASQIPIRSSNADGHAHSTSSNSEFRSIKSNNEETSIIESSRAGSTIDSRVTEKQRNASVKNDGAYLGGLRGETVTLSPRTSSNEINQKISYDRMAESESSGMLIDDYKEAKSTADFPSSKLVTGNGEYNRSVYRMQADSDGEGVHSSSNKNEDSVVYTSTLEDGEITTVRQTFRIVGTIDQDNRCSKESLVSNVDSAFQGSQDHLASLVGDDRSYSNKKTSRSVEFEDVGSDNASKIWFKPIDNIRHEMENEMAEDEEILREELLRIFDRERLTLGSFFKNKMEDFARGCRQRELDVEENSRAEIAELENELSREKAEMQKVFADEIAALTRTFNEERGNIEGYHKEKIRELRDQHAKDQQEAMKKFELEKTELKEKLESEFEAILSTKIGESRKMSLHEINQKEETFNILKLEMERKYEKDLHEAELDTKKVKDELEMMFSQEKFRLEERINDLENQILQERELRIRLETLLEEEKENVKIVDSAKRSETDQLKYELDGLRVELDEKNKAALELSRVEEEVKHKGRNGLSGKLREDVDQIINEHRLEFERKYLMDKEEMQREKERELDKEKKKMKDDVEIEKRKIKDDVENERKKMKDDIAKERQEIQIYLKNGRADRNDQGYQSSSKTTNQAEQTTSLSYQSNEISDDAIVKKSFVTNNNEISIRPDEELEKYSSFTRDLSTTTVNDQFPLENRAYDIEPRMQNSEVSIILQQPGENKMLIDERYTENDQKGMDQATKQETSVGYENKWRYQSNYKYEVGTTAIESKGTVGNDSMKGHFDSSYSTQELPNTSNQPSARTASCDHGQFYVTPGNENDLRSQIKQLRSENEGLKAKIGAMEENIDLHKKYKSEAKDELERLQKVKDTLQSRLDSGQKDEQDAKRAKAKADQLEKSLIESENRRKDFESRIVELKAKLSEAESRAKGTTSNVQNFQHSDKVYSEESKDSRPKIYPVKDSYASQTNKSLQSCSLFEKNKPLDHQDAYEVSSKKIKENVYGYPAELSQTLDFLDYKTDEKQNTTEVHHLNKEDHRTWKDSDSLTKGRLYSTTSPNPIQGSHERLGKKRIIQEKSEYDIGRYSAFEAPSSGDVNTSSPRKPDERSYGKTKRDYHSTSTVNKERKEKYEKAVAERNKLVQLIKQLKLKVEELYAEKERIAYEEAQMRKASTTYKTVSSSTGISSSEHADLKAKVEDMQRKIKELAERLKRDSPRGKNVSYEDNSNYYSTKGKPSIQDIEYLQEKLQRTGDAISHSHSTSDPDVLLRIEQEVKAIGEMIKNHCHDYEHDSSMYRCDGDNVKMVQLQMEKQELEMKLNMAKEAMNDYVNRLSDKMEGLEETNTLSDATLQELHERNAKLKSTLKALEKGQRRSQRQNEELRHQTSALHNVIGQICKPDDASFCSQFSGPRVAGSHTYMAPQGLSKTGDMNISDYFSSY